MRVGRPQLLPRLSDAVACVALDPTKLKARQFSRSANTAPRARDNSLWTETPAERQARIKDEVDGKRKRATEAAAEEDDGLKRDDGKRRKYEAEVKAQVEEYNVSCLFLTTFCADIYFLAPDTWVLARGYAQVEEQRSGQGRSTPCDLGPRTRHVRRWASHGRGTAVQDDQRRSCPRGPLWEGEERRVLIKCKTNNVRSDYEAIIVYKARGWDRKLQPKRAEGQE